MKVLLVCGQGMSTSLLVEAMYQNADEGDVIDAVSVDSLKLVIDDYDVILLGPQIRYKLPDIKALGDAHGKIVDTINMQAYGQMDGAAVYRQVKQLLTK